MELTNIPSQIVTGSTVIFTRSYSDFPSSEWELSYHLRGTGALDVVADPLPDGSFEVTLIASTGPGPTPLVVGKYFYQAYVTNLSDSTDKRLVDNGTVEILIDLSDTGITTYDGRSVAEIMVEAIDAVMTKKATRDQASYTIGQRTLVRIPPDQLLQWRKYYAAIVSNEAIQRRVAAGESPFETIAVEFVPTGHGSR